MLLGEEGDLESLGIDIFVPNSFTLLRAFELQQDYGLDPYDSIALGSGRCANSS